MWYNALVNVPAARTVASRLSSVTWRYNVWLYASPKIGSQVAFFAPHSPNFSSLIKSSDNIAAILANDFDQFPHRRQLQHAALAPVQVVGEQICKLDQLAFFETLNSISGA